MLFTNYRVVINIPPSPRGSKCVSIVKTEILIIFNNSII